MTGWGLRAATAGLLLGAATAAPAAQIEAVEVDHEAQRYRVRMQARIAVPVSAAYAVFTDYARLPQINPSIQQVRLLPGAARPAQRLYTQIRLCAAFYCRTLHQVQDMLSVSTPQGRGLRAHVLPEHSDLHHGRAEWRLRDCGDSTCLEFSATLQPKFWVPPLIGSWLIQRTLRAQAVITAEGIERLAREAA